MPFFFITNHFNCQAEYSLKTDISVGKFNECLIEEHFQISRFCSQNYKIESFIQLVYAMKELDWWPCIRVNIQ